ncbi:MAG TPA: RNA degradosome polyphosphate kinase, partial [Hellea balneolensis]|nr:RNA degradosome polyphosphate kinase [Hellea balneolensis]
MSSPTQNSKQRYFNREISWLAFNWRVMEEAQNTNYPLLERLRFLSISANNLDEFYMVRVAGLRTQAIAGMPALSLDGYTPMRQLQKIRVRAKQLIAEQQKQWKQLQSELFDAGIKVKSVKKLTKGEAKTLRTFYLGEILPLLTPLAIDPAHPFPFIPNLGFGLALALKHKARGDKRKAIVTLPTHVPRFIGLSRNSNGEVCSYVVLEDVLKEYAHELFPSF